MGRRRILGQGHKLSTRKAWGCTTAPGGISVTAPDQAFSSSRP